MSVLRVFLAAMSSSRSDAVTQFVRSFVRNQGVFLSLKRICNDIEGDWEFEKLSRVFKKWL